MGTSCVGLVVPALVLLSVSAPAWAVGRCRPSEDDGGWLPPAVWRVPPRPAMLCGDYGGDDELVEVVRRERVSVGAAGEPVEPLLADARYALIDADNQVFEVQRTYSGGRELYPRPSKPAAAVQRLERGRRVGVVARSERVRLGGECYALAPGEALDPGKEYLWQQRSLVHADPTVDAVGPPPPELRAVPIDTCFDEAAYRFSPLPGPDTWYRWTVADPTTGRTVDGPWLGRTVRIAGDEPGKGAPLEIGRSYVVTVQTIDLAGRLSEARSAMVTPARTGSSRYGSGAGWWLIVVALWLLPRALVVAAIVFLFVIAWKVARRRLG